ncbi:MAG: sensor domain-containing diguanylate cyclase [Lachnospiraceae bacterium]
MIAAIITLLFMFIAYNYLVSKFLGELLEKPRIKFIYYIPVGIINILLSLGFTLYSRSTTFMAYIALTVILFVNILLFHKEKIMICIFYTLSCTLHVMAIRSICVSIFAILTNSTIYNVANSNYSLTLTTAITFFVINLAILFLMNFISNKKIRIVTQHSEQLIFLVSWLILFCIYLIINSRIYSIPDLPSSVLVNQIIAPLVILAGSYIVLFFSFKTSSLLGYKEINEELQTAVTKERQFRYNIDKSLFRSEEIDYTENYIISGFENFKDLLGDAIYSYDTMLAYISDNFVHPEDKVLFQPLLNPQSVIELFENGTTEISFDYRRLMDNKTYEWMHLNTSLFLDSETKHVKGFSQIRNINTEKTQQLELQYKAERDLLTGLYNKGTVESLIYNSLVSEKSKNTTGVLFIIDIDNFKMVNDQLGHLYGDAVLSELSESLHNIFRDSDIVGRIGGDEFIVFATGLLSEKIIRQKAEEICTAFLRTYSNERNIGCTVSSSIGIATFPKDGTDFESLFNCADAALYTSKARGKNCYSFYTKEDTLPYVSTRTEIDTRGMVQKSFRDNRVEYVFRLLYSSEDTKSAIESVLELIAKNFGFSRANIFEFNEMSTHFNGVFEWCANNIPSVSANYIDMPVSNFDFVVSALKESGGMFLATPLDFPEYAREGYTSIGIKSIAHFSIQSQNQLIGVIAFQNCTDDNFHLSGTEYEELRTICQVLSIFMASQLSKEREQRHHQAVRAVIDNMNSIAYVIDRETYTVYYENQNVTDVTKHSSIGSKCYASYRGLDHPCEDCPLQHLSSENPRCTLELYTAKFDIYTKTSAALIDWSNDRHSMLISSVDVTEYKRTRNE